MAVKKKTLVKVVVAKSKSAKQKAVKKTIPTKLKLLANKTKTFAKKNINLKLKPKATLNKKKLSIKKIATKKVSARVGKKLVSKKSINIASSSLSKKVLFKKKLVKESVKKTIAKKSVIKKPVAKSKIAVKKNKSTISSAKKTVKSITKKILLKSPSVVLPKSKSLKKGSLSKDEIKVSSKLDSVKPIISSTEKILKIGVKAKKLIIPTTPVPIIEVSNYPKNKIKTLLISQPKPESEKNPYYDLANKYNLEETFRQFIKIEGLPVKDFRAQRIDILEHKAVILTSRMAVDHYFRMCNEMRVTVPESMKYFCINEATAYYLQKYIQYRKRKIFFGHQTIQDLVDVIRKNRDEKFLLPAADVHKEKICEFLDIINIKYTKAVMYRTVSADLSNIKNLNLFDCLAFFTPAGIKSLNHNFPNFKQGNTRIACFGVATVNELKKFGYRLDIYAPNPKNPSMSGALDDYMKESNKR